MGGEWLTTPFDMRENCHFGSQGTHAYALDAVSARWAAPESLRRSQFSQASDVWSFGVVCWELLSQGDDPYFLKSSDDDVRAIVIGGGNLERPDECSDGFWDIMGQCWEKSPKNRPSFTEIVAQFSQGTPDQVCQLHLSARACEGGVCLRVQLRARVQLVPTCTFESVPVQVLGIHVCVCVCVQARECVHTHSYVA